MTDKETLARWRASTIRRIVAVSDDGPHDASGPAGQRTAWQRTWS